MAEIEKFGGFRTSDGKVFDSFIEASKHAYKMDLAELIDDEVPYSDAQDSVKCFLEDHGDAVLHLLMGIRGEVTHSVVVTRKDLSKESDQ